MRSRATVWLELSESQEQTQLRLRCSLPNQLPTAVLHGLLAQLVYWSGGPLRVVLPADGPSWWSEPLVDALAEVPERHLQVKFRYPVEDGHAE